MADTPHDPLIGATFGGRWSIERPLAAGGMGAVYVARHGDTGRAVALKLIKNAGAADPELVARFRKETAALAAVSHPNVVTFLDSGVDNGTFFLVMELLAGQSLRAIMKVAVPWRRAFAIAADMCRALAALHRLGIVHRDLKPENVFLQHAEGHDEVTKLIDFGVVRRDDAATAGATRTGMVVGTPGYISPEQLRGGTATAASDVYAVGVILYELVAGRFPFAADNSHAMLVRQLIEPVPPPRSINPAVPAHVESLILRMMERDPAQRVATALDALALLVEARQAGTPADGIAASSLPPEAATEAGTAVAVAARAVLTAETPGGAAAPLVVARRKRAWLPWAAAAAACVLVVAIVAIVQNGRGGRRSEGVTKRTVVGPAEVGPGVMAPDGRDDDTRHRKVACVTWSKAKAKLAGDANDRSLVRRAFVAAAAAGQWSEARVLRNRLRGDHPPDVLSALARLASAAGAPDEACGP